MPGEDKSSKTEEPTAKKRQEALSKGQFAKAPEIGMVFILIASFVMVLFTAHAQAGRVATNTIEILGHLHDIEVTVESIMYMGPNGFRFLILFLLPLMGACMLAAVVAGGLQSGFHLTPKVLKADLNKLNPVAGIKRVWSLQSLVQLGIDLLKFIVIGAVLCWVVYAVARDPIFHVPVPLLYIVEFIYETLLKVFAFLIFTLGIIALINLLYQKKKTHEELKMTKQEVKDERKQSQGDPKVKAAQRRMALGNVQKQMLKAVPVADVVVTNPTHFAVALKYERGRDEAPMVVAKGKNLFAQRIKALAREHGVPMVENKPVARMLFRFGEAGKTIPVELYQMVAEILSHVYQSHRYYFHRLQQRRLEAEL